ncbi:MAG TPA: hypothetical protein VFG79_12125, partial [Solirubrobacter sp.]|nr:hypothetical protein [Solirubrobacter sp.]
MKRRELLAAAVAAPVAFALPGRLEAALHGGVTPLALVTADRESHVVALETATGRVVRRIRTLSGPRSIESAFSRWAVVAHTESGRLSILHAPTLSVRHTVAGLRQPRYTAVHPRPIPVGDGRAERPVAYVTDSAG